MIVGLTGGIGSGKSTVAKVFKDLGIAVYDSDSEAKTLMATSKPLKKAIVKLLGPNAYVKDSLNKKYIAKQVFGDDKLLDGLNKLVHPAVKIHFKNWVLEQDSPFVIQETALIFENGAAAQYDAVILVTALQASRIQRVTKRDDASKSEVIRKMEKQLPDTAKIPLADYVIHNAVLEDSKKQVVKIYQELLQKCEEP